MSDAGSRLRYRVWQHDSIWHWEVRAGSELLDFGTAESSAMARVAAFEFCLSDPRCHRLMLLQS